ncbi:uncharacterized protein E5676_scaffold16G004450 [Cucumis melo var. makuwa]|uniref:DUF7731 domain-containing protein n=1 Tax=Cucumis melo var. makuwa TaxID=1194695 RepID=A0A5A7U972_CUCMM|nr:uncharacterized protein E6C27_scaffold761G00740 [Cucumis melo var. makuwa]TYK10294.1 uncharacterized protein E5676_scaffold16G004450 [Cucumis melo var. makuwa]
MASPISFLPVVLALVVSLRCPSVNGDQEISGQMVVESFKCFDNKFIYNGCESAYRLNPSGSFNVPPEATNLFCNGPCLIETQLLLNCLDNSFHNFLFYNKATAQSVRNALRIGCSFSSQRGRPYVVGQLHTLLTQRK